MGLEINFGCECVTLLIKMVHHFQTTPILLLKLCNGACVFSDAWILTLYASIQKQYEFDHTKIGPSLLFMLNICQT